ncbi:MAG: LL-diaminopimelate aminotransferase [Solirubrobacteraceae bacterium]|jgi:LL-diaminopimelate aminotransferase|nr:LL-diaminopimelate aminotransferase [Solirubrobacteraceae bacterium]
MRPSDRLALIPPYLFAELERKIAAKRAAGVDVISLGIGDPDTPTYAPIVAAAQAAVADPSTHQYPSNRGRTDFREALVSFYDRRFGVDLDPATELIPAIGAKECIFNLNLAFLNPGDVTLAADPGYPVYSTGPLLAGGEPVLMPLVPELGFIPDLDAIDPETRERARLLFVNYPNNPTGAVVPDGFFERLVEFGAENDILIVHDNAYSETTYDGYVAPSFLATPGAKDVGVEVFSLSKGYCMTGWRCAAILGNADAIAAYWKLKTNIDSGLFEAVQIAGAAALAPEVDADVDAMNAVYRRRRDLVCRALAEIGVDVTPPRATIYVWAPVPAGFETAADYCEHVLEQAAVVISPGGAYGPNGEGFFRISLTTPDDRLTEAVARLGSLL